MASEPPQTEAIDDEPLDSVISETMRMVYWKSSGAGSSGISALGQAAVADFAALGHADAAGFAGGERRHVVVQHEAVAVLAHERVNDLLVLLGAQRGHDQRLGFTAGEQGAAVRARQHAQAHADGTHGAGVATIDTRFAVQDLAADDGRFQREQDVVDGDGVRRRLALLGGGGVQLADTSA